MAREEADAGGHEDSSSIRVHRPIRDGVAKLETSTPCHATKATNTNASRTEGRIVMLAKQIVVVSVPQNQKQD